MRLRRGGHFDRPYPYLTAEGICPEKRCFTQSRKVDRHMNIEVFRDVTPCRFIETSADIFQSTWPNIPEDESSTTPPREPKISRTGTLPVKEQILRLTCVRVFNVLYIHVTVHHKRFLIK
jgi:hypothetical protein